MPKHVVSTTLMSPGWNNSHVISANAADEIRKLKSQRGGDIVIHGSPTLVRSLMDQDVIDEYRLLVYPIVLGAGKRLFDESSKAKLKLIEATTFEKGVVKMVFEPVRG